MRETNLVMQSRSHTFAFRGPAKAPTPASAEGASLNLINFNYPPKTLKYDTS